jgi:hypothetical protein
MSATLSRIAALVLFLWTPLPVRADKIDTEHLFVFTIGTDPGELGEKEIEGQSTGRFGKRDGSYTGFSQMFSAELLPWRTSVWRLAPRLSITTFLGSPASMIGGAVGGKLCHSMCDTGCLIVSKRRLAF